MVELGYVKEGRSKRGDLPRELDGIVSGVASGTVIVPFQIFPPMPSHTAPHSQFSQVHLSFHVSSFAAVFAIYSMMASTSVPHLGLRGIAAELFSENVVAKILRTASEGLENNVRVGRTTSPATGC
jgi:hypothetical protein